MNIKDNIKYYLNDKEYCIAIYNNHVYINALEYLDNFNDAKISVQIKNQLVMIFGVNLSIERLTKDEILIKGEIKKIEMKNNT